MGGEPRSVVLDRQQEAVVALGQPDLDPGRLGVGSRVGHGLLRDPEEDPGGVQRRPLAEGSLDGAGERLVLADDCRVLPERGRKVLVEPVGDVEVVEQPAQPPAGLTDRLGRVVEHRRPVGVTFHGQVSPRALQPEAHRGDGLDRVVVHVGRDPSALGLLGLVQVEQQPALLAEPTLGLADLLADVERDAHRPDDGTIGVVQG